MSRCRSRQWRVLIGCGLVEGHEGRHVGVGTHMGWRCRAAWDDIGHLWRLGSVWRASGRERLNLSTRRPQRLP